MMTTTSDSETREFLGLDAEGNAIHAGDEVTAIRTGVGPQRAVATGKPWDAPPAHVLAGAIQQGWDPDHFIDLYFPAEDKHFGWHTAKCIRGYQP